MTGARFLVTREQVMYMLGVSARTISNLQNRVTDPLPIEHKGHRGNTNQYDPAAVLAWKVRQEIAALGVQADGTVIDYDAERARLTKAQADHEELKVLQLRGDLISLELVAQAWSDHITAARSKILGLPIRLAQVAIAATTIREIEDAARAEVNQALQELSDDLTQQADRDPASGGAEVEAAASFDGQ